ncbi:MAG: hypothetical protein IPO12_05200 [Flavobacteriales bacterium]|nr:hypothetical protein [Flavobacteriales bacterium]
MAALGWVEDELERIPVQIPIDPPLYQPTADRLRNISGTALDSILANNSTDTAIGTRDKLRRSLALLPEADSLNVPYRVSFRGSDKNFQNRWMEAVLRRGNLTAAEADSILVLRGNTSEGLQKRIALKFLRLAAQDSSSTDEFLNDLLKSMPLPECSL